MRKCLTLSFCLLGGSIILADTPSGSIVIRPQGTTPTPAAPPSPDRPGMIVIRPQAPGTRALETPIAVPPTAPPTNQNPIPVPDPKPVADPKPMTPGQPIKPAAEAEKGKILAETWDVAYVKGLKVGYFHVVVREHQRDGKSYIYSTKTQELTVGRFGQKVTTSREDSTLETTDGTILVARMSQAVSSGQKLSVTGTVDGTVLRVKAEGMLNGTDSVPWPEGVLSISKEMSVFKDRKPKPGDTFDYSIYEGLVSRAVNVKVKCLELETVALFEGQAPKSYLKVEAQMQKLGVFQIPAATMWIDAETYEPIRTDQNLPSLGGRLVLVRTTKEVALRPVGEVPELFDVQSIKLDKAIPFVHDKASITYKIDLSIDPEPYTCFPKDDFNDRQTPKLTGADRKTVELKVLHGKLVNYQSPKSDRDRPSAEVYLGKSFFIDWDNDITKKQAATIQASLSPSATDADKAKAVESWVHKNMKAVDFSQAMAPTSETSKTLSGDCTEYSMLAVGLCRALKLPSRTALGLVYAPGSGGKPVLAYHMWFEVWHDGHWVSYDATLGRGGIGPGHLKITDAHWHKENSFAPLLPVLRVLIAQPKVTVGEIEEMK